MGFSTWVVGKDGMVCGDDYFCVLVGEIYITTPIARGENEIWKTSTNHRTIEDFWRLKEILAISKHSTCKSRVKHVVADPRSSSLGDTTTNPMELTLNSTDSKHVHPIPIPITLTPILKITRCIRIRNRQTRNLHLLRHLRSLHPIHPGRRHSRLLLPPRTSIRFRRRLQDLHARLLRILSSRHNQLPAKNTTPIQSH